MASTIIPSCSFTCTRRVRKPYLHTKCSSTEKGGGDGLVESERSSIGFLQRRAAVLAGVSTACAVLGLPGSMEAMAVKQGLLAGRIPGLSDPDENGWRTYRRPDEKSGGHGVGWSPIIPYSFSVPPEWEEVPVSIADLGGTEIDLRFADTTRQDVNTFWIGVKLI